MSRSIPYEVYDDEAWHAAVHDSVRMRADAVELRKLLVCALVGLPAHLYEIVKYRFFAGFTFRQMGEVLGLPVSTMKSREDAAIKRVRSFLLKNGF